MNLQPMQFDRPSPRMKKYIREVRTGERRNQSYERAGGQCGTVSEENEVRFGWPTTYGTHEAMNHDPEDEHVWNKLPNGSILDGTADQFGGRRDHRGVRIIPPTHPDYQKYREF